MPKYSFLGNLVEVKEGCDRRIIASKMGTNADLLDWDNTVTDEEGTIFLQTRVPQGVPLQEFF